ncbi:hypothetical protein JD844_006629 [Phrynosoma platyrhinos]|uniref:Uncharacterized protein n=1 Tax=Phrynosoma platyrhinos TaxID=52577 RepID=A0ABQ7T213_PHRPL|nr:hypothetical protein JD844_006629 [Phrynosoma platyrhinos]
MEIVVEQRQRREQRRRPGELFCLHEPERKRVCRSSEMIYTPHPPSKCAADVNAMEQDLNQDDLTEYLNPQIIKEKLNCMIFPDNETRAPAQLCPRCIAGEPCTFLTTSQSPQKSWSLRPYYGVIEEDIDALIVYRLV